MKDTANKMRFIQVNNRIFDYYTYDRELFIVKSHLLMLIYDLSKQHGFRREGSYLVNKELNCRAKIIFEKIETEKFI